jgi:hypothetical protein
MDHEMALVNAFVLPERWERLAESCHVISTNRELDGRDVDLAVALAGIVGTGDGSLVSCIPGRLGYFEDESSRFILAKGAA